MTLERESLLCAVNVREPIDISDERGLIMTVLGKKIFLGSS